MEISDSNTQLVNGKIKLVITRKDTKESQDINEARETKNAEEPKEPEEPKEAKEAKEPKEDKNDKIIPNIQDKDKDKDQIKDKDEDQERENDDDQEREKELVKDEDEDDDKEREREQELVKDKDEDEDGDQESKRFFCYILKNKVSSQIHKTYNGFTVDLMRRIRQHNSEIKGGARYTTSNGNKTWHYYAVLTGFDTNVSALSCEWWIKHPTGNRRRPIAYSGPRGRILGLQKVLEDVRFKGYKKTLEYTLWIDRNYLCLLNPRTIKPNIRIMTFTELQDITEFYRKE